MPIPSTDSLAARVSSKLGVIPDATIAREFGVSRERIRQIRSGLGIPPCLECSDAVLRARGVRRAAITSRCEKPCTKCRIVKPLDAFYKCRSTIDGRQSRCRACQQSTIKARHHSNARRHLHELINGAGTRSRKAGLPFDLQDHFPELWVRFEPGRCELTGLSFSTGPRGAFSASIDRINPKLGYVHDNVRFICWGLNAALGNWGEATLRVLAEAWILGGKGV